MIAVQALTKTYDKVQAVKGIDFQVAEGEVFGLLGPNGAGKTSTIEILEGLRPRTGGEATVLGFDPDRQKQQLKDRIRVLLQATDLPAKIRRAGSAGPVWIVLLAQHQLRETAQSAATVGQASCVPMKRFPAGKNSVWPWRWHWSMIRSCSFWTNRPQALIRKSGWRRFTD